jgi:hypothetical protein
MKNLLIFALLSLVTITFAQESDSSDPIFSYSTCMSPCWMDITPGVSTSLDIDTMLEQHSDIVTIGEYGRNISRLPNGKYAVDETTGRIEQGGYSFEVLTPTSQFSTTGVSSRIEIQNGLVDLVMILASQEYDISLSTILDNLGEPAHIRMYSTDDFDTSEFKLIYTDSLTYINLYQSGAICQTDNLLHNFNLLNIFYHSQQSASEPWQSIDPNILQPKLLTYRFETERDVPLDVWQSWLNDEVSESCFEAWQKLEPPNLETIAVTPTPEVEIPLQPLNAEDECYPPCWLGLIPDKTNINDVATFLRNNDYLVIVSHADRLDNLSDETLWEDATIEFLWADPPIRIPSYRKSEIHISDNIVDSLIILAREIIPLQRILDTYGNPDIATWYFGIDSYLYFIYVNESMVVKLGILPETEFESYGKAFVVYTIHYFSPSDLSRIFDLYATIKGNLTRFVLTDIIQCWADGKEHCISSWWGLPEDKDIDLSPWLEVTPEVEVTTEPSS